MRLSRTRKARGSLKTHPAFRELPPGEPKKKLDFIDPVSGKRVIAIAQRTQYGWTMVAQQDYEEVYRPLTQANLGAGIVLAIVIVGVVTFSYFLAQRFTRPIVTFTHIAENISRGNLGARIPETTRSDEIGSLARHRSRLAKT